MAAARPIHANQAELSLHSQQILARVQTAVAFRDKPVIERNLAKLQKKDPVCAKRLMAIAKNLFLSDREKAQIPPNLTNATLLSVYGEKMVAQAIVQTILKTRNMGEALELQHQKAKAERVLQPLKQAVVAHEQRRQQVAQLLERDRKAARDRMAANASQPVIKQAPQRELSAKERFLSTY
jgi:hypothetical protein